MYEAVMLSKGWSHLKYVLVEINGIDPRDAFVGSNGRGGIADPETDQQGFLWMWMDEQGKMRHQTHILLGSRRGARHRQTAEEELHVVVWQLEEIRSMGGVAPQTLGSNSVGPHQGRKKISVESSRRGYTGDGDNGHQYSDLPCLYGARFRNECQGERNERHEDQEELQRVEDVQARCHQREGDQAETEPHRIQTVGQPEVFPHAL